MVMHFTSNGLGITLSIGKDGVDIFIDGTMIAAIDTANVTDEGHAKAGTFQTVIYDHRPGMGDTPIACAVHTGGGVVIHPADAGIVDYRWEFSQAPCIVTNDDMFAPVEQE